MNLTSAALALGALALFQPQAAEPPREIPSGAPATAEIGGKERHRYTTTVPRGGFLRLVVEQYGVDVVVRLLGPDAGLLTTVDGLTGENGPETVLLVSPAGGVYTVEVVGPPHGAPGRGRYSIRIEESRPATSSDEQRVAATWAYDEATELRYEGTGASQRRALERYAEALPLWRALGDRAGEANTLRWAGRVHSMLDQNPEALRSYEEALELYRAAGDREAIGILLNDIGIVYDRRSDFDAALASYEEALPHRRATDDVRGEATTLHNIATAYMALDDLDTALRYHAQALPLRRKARDRPGEGYTLHSLGQTHVALGDYQQGLDYYAEALALRRAIRDREGEGATLHNLGTAALGMGEPEQALAYLEQSLENRRLRGDRRNEAFVLFNMGRAQNALGQPAEAERLFRAALEINRSLADPRGVGRSLKALGDLQAERGDHAAALGLFEEALEKLQAGRDRRGEAQARSALGLARSALGKGDEADAGLAQALAIQQAIGDREGQADSWAARARLAERRGDLEEAQRDLETALALVEEVRARVLAPDQRAAFLAGKRSQQRRYVDVLMARHARDPRGGHAAAAFVASDHARARSLREVLLAGASPRADADPQLLEKERAVQAQLNAKERQRLRLASSGGTAARAQQLEREIGDLLAEYRGVQARLRAESPRYSALTAPPAVSLAEVQALLGERTVLLEYALGEERSYLWVVTGRALHSHVLPPGKQLEEGARRVHELLSRSPRRTERVAGQLAAEALARTLLGPAASALPGKRVVVVADGALQYVPFAALPAPGGAAEPMIARHELVMLPSAALAATLRVQAHGRPPAARGVAVFADPVLGSDDPRVAGVPAPSNVASASDVMRSARDTGVERFERLAYTREEAQAIARLAGGAGLLALDFAASRAAALAPELADYRIVHFATHGLVNSRRPELSGVVLSLVDKDGQPKDGFLRLHDVYNLRLNADLVVLSACRTALGRQVSGEGLVGLTRGFMFAGAPRVVASLWDVRDQATAELMTRFYRGLLRERLRPAAALRAAQLSMWKDPRWQAPFYWSGFSLQGDWN